MTAAVIAAAQSRLTAAFPEWLDQTGNPNPTPLDKLPAWRVAVTYSSSERVGMGDVEHWRTGQLEVTIETPTGKETVIGKPSAPADIHTAAGQVADAIMAAPNDLGGACWEIAPDGFDSDQDVGADRVSRGDMIFAILVLD